MTARGTQLASAVALGSMCALALGAACKSKDDGADKEADDQDQAQERPPEKPPEPPDEATLPPTKELVPAPDDQSGEGVWAVGFGANGIEGGRAAAIDAAGNVAVGGYFEGAVDFGGETAIEADDKDGYVAYFDAEGKHRWVVAFGGSNEDLVTDVAFDGDGNVYATGNFAGKVTVGDTTLEAAGSDDVIVVKIEADGTVAWARRFGGIDSDGGSGIAVDGDGNIYVTGSFTDDIKLGEHLHESDGGLDAFVASLGPDGAVRWSAAWGDWGRDIGRRIAVDVQSNVVVLVEFKGKVDFGGGVVESAGNQDIGLVKLSRDGAYLWSKGFGSPFNELPKGLATDPAGNIAVAGSYDNEIDFGGGTMKSAGESDVFVAKFDGDGKHVWSKSFGGTREDVASGVGMDSFGNVVATGWFSRKVDFGGGELATPEDNKDVFAVKLSPEGAHVWSKRFGDRDSDLGSAIAVSPTGEIAVAGVFRFTLEIAQQSLESAREPDEKAPHGDVFVARLRP